MAAKAKPPVVSPPKGGKPTALSQYRMVKELGEGTYGKVWGAEDKTDAKRQVAIKIITRDPDAESEGELGIPSDILNEISIQKHLRHPNIAPLLDVIVDEDKVYIIQPWMKGGSLKSSRDRFTPMERLVIAGRVLCGIKYMHENGFLHLDFKPGNVLVDEKGNPMISDFGLAQYFKSARHTRVPNSLITWPFRPPEMLCGYTKYDEKADLWSYGVFLLYFLFDVDLFDLVTEEKLYPQWIHDNLGWPTSFSARFSTDARDFDVNYVRKCKQLKVSPPPSSEEKFVQVFIPDANDKKKWKEAYGDHWSSIWTLVRNTLQVDPDDRSVKGAGTLFAGCPVTDRPMILKQPTLTSLALYRKWLGGLDMSEQTITLAAILLDTLKQKLLEETKQPQLRKAKQELLAADPLVLQLLAAIVAAKHLNEEERPHDKIMGKVGDPEYPEWDKLDSADWMMEVYNLEPSFLLVLGNSIWDAALVPPPSRTSRSKYLVPPFFSTSTSKYAKHGYRTHTTIASKGRTPRSNTNVYGHTPLRRSPRITNLAKMRK